MTAVEPVTGSEPLPPPPPARGALPLSRSSFVAYVARRLGYALVIVWLAYTLSFVLLWLLPSNPVELMLAGGGGAAASSPEVIAAAERHYGVDRNPFAQYFILIGRALHGDLGTSINTGREVSTMLIENAGPTIWLGVSSLAIGLLLGIGLALLANATRWEWLRTTLFSVPPFIASVPTFWSGLILIQIFAFQLDLLPAVGGGPAGLILPAITLGVAVSAGIAQIAARGLEENLTSAYADYLRAKGVPDGRILVHALRNALIPIVTLLGVYVGAVFAGAVITETVFSRQGLGRVMQTAVTMQDIPVVQGIVILCALSFALFNLAVDLLYPLIDPRVSTH